MRINNGYMARVPAFAAVQALCAGMMDEVRQSLLPAARHAVAYAMLIEDPLSRACAVIYVSQQRTVSRGHQARQVGTCDGAN